MPRAALPGASPLDRARREDQSGFTLIELMVTMSILGMLLAALAGGLIGITRATNTIDVRTDNVDQARLAVTALSRDLRAAAPTIADEPAFIVAEPHRAEFHALLGDSEDPVKITIAIDEDDRLIETLTPPVVQPDGTLTYPVSGEVERFVASYIFNDDDEPVLRYSGLDAAGQIETLDDTSTEQGLRAIRVVTIDLKIARDREARVAAQRMMTDVRLPNLRGAT